MMGGGNVWGGAMVVMMVCREGFAVVLAGKGPDE